MKNLIVACVVAILMVSSGCGKPLIEVMKDQVAEANKAAAEANKAAEGAIKDAEQKVREANEPTHSICHLQSMRALDSMVACGNSGTSGELGLETEQGYSGGRSIKTAIDVHIGYAAARRVDREIATDAFAHQDKADEVNFNRQEKMNEVSFARQAEAAKAKWEHEKAMKALELRIEAAKAKRAGKANSLLGRVSGLETHAQQQEAWARQVTATANDAETKACQLLTERQQAITVMAAPVNGNCPSGTCGRGNSTTQRGFINVSRPR